MHHRFTDRRDFTIEKVSVWHYGTLYTGKGTLHWDPELGFHIDAVVTGETLPESGPTSFAFVPIPNIENYSTIRMVLSKGRYAITAPLHLGIGHKMDLHFNRRLSVRVTGLSFLQHGKHTTGTVLSLMDLSYANDHCPIFTQ